MRRRRGVKEEEGTEGIGWGVKEEEEDEEVRS